MEQLKDTDIMPFGKYGPDKGDPKPMQDVPASYLHWLWTNGKENETKTCPVADYIKRNLTGLAKDYPNGIW
jgi:hypothetical protein